MGKVTQEEIKDTLEMMIGIIGHEKALEILVDYYYEEDMKKVG